METEARSVAEHATPASALHAKVIVVMPARNAARTLEATVSAIPTEVVDEVILVDDKSTDSTLDVARRLPLHLIWHPHNVGYGGNQKTCYLEALQRGADAVVMLHPDGQYEPSLIPRMVEPILSGQADMVLGSRLTEPGSWKQVGMPRYKFVANRGLTVIENLLLGTSFTPAMFRAVSMNASSCFTSMTSVLPLAPRCANNATVSFVFLLSGASSLSTTVSAPSLNFAASAARSAPSFTFRGSA